MKNGGGHFAPKLGGHFELESGGHFKLECCLVWRRLLMI